MRRILSLFLVLLMLISLCACGTAEQSVAGTTQTQPQDQSDQVKDDKVLKVLAIGNSFSVDTMQYLAAAAKAEGFKEVKLGNLYIGGCKLETHALNASSDLPAYKFYTNLDGAWQSQDGCSLSFGLKFMDWDIITMQQGSTQSGKPDTYEPYLTDLINYVNENKTNPNAKLAWNMTWAYQADFEKDMFTGYNRDQALMYNAICSTVKEKILPHTEFTYLMPVGTAIQNARTSYMGDHMTRDGYHLSELGRVIGSYTWLATFLGKPLETVNLTMVGATLVLDETDKKMIVETVNAALAENFTVTQSAYTQK